MSAVPRKSGRQLIERRGRHFEDFQLGQVIRHPTPRAQSAFPYQSTGRRTTSHDAATSSNASCRLLDGQLLGERLMENPKVTTMKEVQATFAAWKTVHDRIRVLEKAVQPSDSPPVDLAEMDSELKALQLESERLLQIAQHALLTIKTPRTSSGDSTWGH